ncbi:MAG: hypothetical protein PUE06_00105 [Bacteroidales bacterium]|nr:hypothetical protein [Bacteroidales bacterium]
MKKKIFSVLAVAAAFVACNKVVEPIAPEQDAKNLVINVTIPDTKLSYTEMEDGCYKAGFSPSDELWMIFTDADGTAKGNVNRLPVDGKSISHDKKSASFILPAIKIPSDATHIVGYLANSAAPNSIAKADSIIFDLSSQSNQTAALNSQLLGGTVAISDLSQKDANTFVVNFPMVYKTSLLKFELTLPEDVTLDKSKTTVSISGKGLHSKIHLQSGKAGVHSEYGNIVANAASIEGNKVIAYASVWAEDDLNSYLIVNSADTYYYSAAFKPEKTVEAGKSYNVSRNLKSFVSFNKWVGDNAGSMDVPIVIQIESAPTSGVKSASQASSVVTSDFLTCDGKTITWTENTTGAPRTAKLVLYDECMSFEITQLAPSDFKSSWGFIAKSFASNGAAHAAADPFTVTLNPVDARVKESVVAADGKSYTNTFGLTGLCGSAVLDACVIVDYEAKSVKMGLFLDTREGAGQEVDGNLVVFYPGLATVSETAWGKPWLYAVPEQGNPDFSYLWLTSSEDLNTFVYKNRVNADIPLQILSQYSDSSMNAIVGIGVGITTDKTIGAGSISNYSNFFQINPNGYEGMTMVKR